MNALPAAVIEHMRNWHVSIDQLVQTQSSWIAYGQRRDLPVVLKVASRPNDEWRSGDILRAFHGRKAARVYEHVPGAVLMERLSPGTPLVELSLSRRDNEATQALADVMAGMTPDKPECACPSVEDWGRAFDVHQSRISSALVEHARQVFEELARSQTNRRLLHGDLHHYNVLLDRDRGWLAVDPKGVFGEIEYEIGAALRNPVERPDLFVDALTVEKRLNVFASKLPIDGERALRWTFAQAVLAALWKLEDGADLTPREPLVRLAETIRPMLVS